VATNIEPQQDSAVNASPWITAKDAADYIHCGVKTIYDAVKKQRLRAARVSGRRELRFRREWLDQFLEASAQPVEVRR
jgi:excisionase family DNA binding protein